MDNPKVKEIKIIDPIPFSGDVMTDFTTSADMAEVINSVFAPIFHDFHGSRVCVNDGSDPTIFAAGLPMGALYVDLFFKDFGEVKSDDKGGYPIKNLTSRIAPIKTDDGAAPTLQQRIAAYNGNIGNARAYNVTNETFDILSKFMTFGPRTRWMDLVHEETLPSAPYGKDQILVSIHGIDLNRLVGEIYGTRTKEGNFEYSCNMSTIIPGKNREFIIEIKRLDTAVVGDLQRKLGIYAAQAPQFHQYQR